MASLGNVTRRGRAPQKRSGKIRYLDESRRDCSRRLGPGRAIAEARANMLPVISGRGVDEQHYASTIDAGTRRDRTRASAAIH